MRPTPSLLLPLALLVAMTGCVRRVVLTPRGTQAPAAEPPPGTVEANFVSDYGDRVWDVRVNGEIVCETPCVQWVGDTQPLALTRRSGEAIELPPLALEAPGAQRALIVAEGKHRGKQVNGIVFTTLGGMGLVTAITLTAVGCSNLERRPGTCTAGLVTGAITAPLTAAAILLLLDSMPKAHVLPVFRSEAAAGQAPVTVVVTPTGVAGTF